MKISVIGSGYVGLITGLLFSAKGYETVCIDIIPEKVDLINHGFPPFYEPELKRLLDEGLDSGLFSASINGIDEINTSDISFICVGTPPKQDGSANLSFIKHASKNIGLALRNSDRYHVIATKSTVPPNTTREIILPLVEEYSEKKVGVDFGICMNPEFLKQGSAVTDAFSPDRIVIGEYDKRSGDYLENVFSGFNCPKIRCDLEAAELIKYAANSFLATKISFANEFARISETFNVDVYEVMKGVGFDNRINSSFLNAGVGFGGSCFPKDVKAIISLAEKKGVNTPILNAVIETNEIQPIHLIDLIKKTVGTLEGKTIGFLGLSFKPNTDDVRETRALPMITALNQEGAQVKVYDPEALQNFARIVEIPIQYTSSWKEALNGADLAIIHTDWDEIKKITAEEFRTLLKTPIVFDGRRTFNPEYMINGGIVYRGIGWKNL